MIKVTGHMIKEALKTKQLELATVQTLFEESLYKFEGDDKTSPLAVAIRIDVLEKDIAHLQTLQSRYNLGVDVKIIGDRGKGFHIISLELAIKLVGGAGRLSKRWRDAAKGKEKDRYERRQLPTKNKDEETAVPNIAKEKALELAIAQEKYASSIRTAITTGNLTEIEFEDTVSYLFA